MAMNQHTQFDTTDLQKPPLSSFEFRASPIVGNPCLTARHILIQQGNRDFGEAMMAMPEEQIDPKNKILPFAWGRMGGGTNTAVFAIFGHLFGRAASDAMGIKFAQQL